MIMILVMNLLIPDTLNIKILMMLTIKIRILGSITDDINPLTMTPHYLIFMINASIIL